MKIKQIVRDNVKSAQPEQSLVDIAQTMKSENIGLMPIAEGGKLLGVVTDRDIVVRGLAQKSDPLQMTARDAMTSPVQFCHVDDPVEKAARTMQEFRVRRLPVLDSNERLVGVVSLDDIAAQASPTLAGETLRTVSEARDAQVLA